MANNANVYYRYRGQYMGFEYDLVKTFADRLGVELMGIDYREVKYLQWCADAGMGNDDLTKINIIGPDYKKHITKYAMHQNIEKQREWLREDFKS